MADVYTFDQARDEVIARLGGRTDIDDRTVNWLDSAQLQMAKSDIELPRLETVSTAFQVASGISEYSLLTVFIDDIIGIRSLRNTTSNWRMQHFPWREYRTLSSQASGPPVRWSRNGNTVAVDPKPDAVYQILIDYRRRPGSGIMEVNGEWQETLINLAASIGATALQMPDVARTFLALIPQHTLGRIQNPLGQDEWEGFWSDTAGLVPAWQAWNEG